MTQEVSYEYFDESQTIHFSATSHPRDLILLIRGVTIDKNVFQVVDAIGRTKLEQTESHQQLKEQGSGWMFENHNLWIRPASGMKGVFTVIQGIKNV